jgi:hypothetical protein
MVDLLVRTTLVVLAVVALGLAPLGIAANLAGLLRGRVSAVDAAGGTLLCLVAPLLLLAVAVAGPGNVGANVGPAVQPARPLQPISNLT